MLYNYVNKHKLYQETGKFFLITYYVFLEKLTIYLRYRSTF